MVTSEFLIMIYTHNFDVGFLLVSLSLYICIQLHFNHVLFHVTGRRYKPDACFESSGRQLVYNAKTLTTLFTQVLTNYRVLQSCRSLLKTMVLDNHIMVRKMAQKTAAPPAILSGLLGSQFKKSKLILREHFFANPNSTTLL